MRKQCLTFIPLFIFFCWPVFSQTRPASTGPLAQDTFEIEVHEYDTLAKSKWDLDTHFAYLARGTKTAADGVAPTDKQSRFNLDLTRGLTENVDMASHLLLAYRPGSGFEYAGLRLRTKVKAPSSWDLPVNLALMAEIGFPQSQYEANSVTFELRPIISKTFSQWRLTVNPTITRALRGVNTKEGFHFEPSAKITYFVKNNRFHPGLEYYSLVGPLTSFRRRNEQVHTLFPTVDIRVNEHLRIHLGIGFGLTDTGERLILKSRIGYQF